MSPRALSEIGAFSSMEAREPAASLMGYSVQSALWSDGADKQRWGALPEAERVGFAAVGPRQFPEQRLVLAQALNGGQNGATYLIEPGSPERSVLFQRNATLSSGLRMPPLSRHRRDERYLDQLERWITSLAPAPPP